MANDPISNLIDVSAIQKQVDAAINSTDKLFDSIKKGFDSVNAMQIKIGTNSSGAGLNELKKQSEEVTRQMSSDARAYTNLWKQLLAERDAAEKAASDEQKARQKQAAAEERELNKMIAAEEKVLLAQSRAERRAAIAERKQADRDYQNTWKQLLKERDDMERQAAMQRKKEAAEAAMRVSADSVAGMSKTLNELRYGWDRLTKAERDNAEIGGVLLARIQQLDTELKATDAATGRFARNVGNYTNAVTPLQRQLGLIAGELPNLQYGFRTFASSFSNQVAGIMEAVRQTIAQNKALRAEGKETISLARQLATGFLTWQTVILTLAGVLPVLIERLFSAKKETKELSEQSKEYADSQKRLAENIGKEVAELNVLLVKASDVNRTYKERGAAVDDLQKKFPEYFAALSREAILNGDVADAVDMATDAIIRRAREAQRIEKYTAAVTKLAAMEEELNNIQNPGKGNFVYDNGRGAQLEKEIFFQRKKVDELAKTLLIQEDVNAKEAYWLDENLKKQHEANQAKEKANALLTEEERKERDRLAKLKPKADKFTDEKEAIEAQKRIAENEEMTFSQRYDAAVKYSQLSDELLKKQNKHSLDNIIIYATEADKLFKKINDDQAKAMAARQKQIEEQSKQTLQIIMDQMNNVAQNENVNRERNLKDLADSLKRGEITLKEYNTRKEQINAASDAIILQGQKDALNDYLAEQGLLPDEIARIQEAITNIENLQSKKRISIFEEEARVKAKAAEQLHQLQKQLENDLVEFLSAAANRRFEKRLKEIEKEGELVDADKEKKIDAIKESSLTQEEQADRIKVVEAEAAEQKKKLDDEAAEQKRKQAILNKGIAIAGIALKLQETLAAINLTIAELNAVSFGVAGTAYGAAAIPLAIASAAVQTATVIATPIPEYAEGKDASDPYTGRMLWGEAGTEMKIDRHGRLQIATKPTYGYTEKGDTILSNEDLRSGALADYFPSVSAELDAAEVLNGMAEIQADNTKKIVKAIKSIRPGENVSERALLAKLAARK